MRLPGEETQGLRLGTAVVHDDHPTTGMRAGLQAGQATSEELHSIPGRDDDVDVRRFSQHESDVGAPRFAPGLDPRPRVAAGQPGLEGGPAVGCRQPRVVAPGPGDGDHGEVPGVPGVLAGAQELGVDLGRRVIASPPPRSRQQVEALEHQAADVVTGHQQLRRPAVPELGIGPPPPAADVVPIRIGEVAGGRVVQRSGHAEQAVARHPGAGGEEAHVLPGLRAGRGHQQVRPVDAGLGGGEGELRASTGIRPGVSVLATTARHR